MKAYKGFNKDMTCRGFQFEEGKTYEEQEAKLCKRGFHACENPVMCFNHYAPNVHFDITPDAIEFAICVPLVPFKEETDEPQA